MPHTFASHVRREALTNGITNAVFNGLIAWWLVRHRDSIPVWGDEGLAVDFIATAIILVFIVSLIVMPMTRRKVASGVLPTTVWQTGTTRSVLEFMARRHLAVCALLLGLLSAVLFVPPTLLLTEALSISALSAEQFAVVKALWAGVVAAVMVVAMISIVAVAKSNEVAGDQL